MIVVPVAILVAGCTSSTGGSAPSTIAPGSPWLGAFASVTPPTPVNALEDVDCATALRCWAVGSTVGTAGAPNGAAVITTTNGGSSWRTQAVPATVGYLSAISCSDVRHCTAVGQAAQTSNGAGEIIATSDGGATWAPDAVPSGILDVTAVSCRSNHWCMATGNTAAGTVALVSSSAQAGWVQVGTLSAGVSSANSISCPDEHHCWIAADSSVDVDHVAGVVDMTSDGGATWVPTPMPKGVGLLNSISCLAGTGGRNGLPFTSTTVSPTTAPTVAGSTTGPATTTSSVVPPTTTTTPPTTTTTTTPPGEAGVWCAAVGTTAATLTGSRTGHGVILTTVDGGTQWSSQPLLSNVAALMDVSCTALDACVSVGSSITTSAQAGVVVLTGPSAHPWKRAAAVGSPQPLSAVSCVSATRCIVVGESITEHLAAT